MMGSASRAAQTFGLLGLMKQRPLFGCGYEIEGAILENKYFPLWYGP
jgi:hypothetical protein